MASQNTKRQSDIGTQSITLELYGDFASLEKDWRGLQEKGVCSFYQSFEWCSAWHHTLGVAKKSEPVLVCARNGRGKCVFILPLARQSIGASKIVTWVGVPELTYGFGIYDRDFLANAQARLQELWPRIIDKLKPADAIWLCDQPEILSGQNNPLSFVFTQQNPNRGYRVALNGSYDELFANKRSASSRRGIRKRDKKLQDSGDLKFGLPNSLEEARNVIDRMLDHQSQRLAAKGVTNFYSEQRKSFLYRLVDMRDGSDELILLPYHLTVDGHVVAVMLGGQFQNIYWALIASLTPDTKFHALSPGDYALRATIKDLCDKGFDVLDFAAGDTDYKLHWRDETIQLFDTIVPLTFKGRVWAALRSGRIYLKNTIKKNRVFFDLALRIRKFLFAR